MDCTLYFFIQIAIELNLNRREENGIDFNIKLGNKTKKYIKAYLNNVVLYNFNYKLNYIKKNKLILVNQPSLH